MKLKENRPFKPISDEKYAKILLRYSFVDIKDPMSREAALSKVNLVLPENWQEVRSKSPDDYELVFCSSDKWSFIVLCLGCERVFNDDKSFSHNNKDNIHSISYFKSI